LREVATLVGDFRCSDAGGRSRLRPIDDLVVVLEGGVRRE
jgi:hypothetical protein